MAELKLFIEEKQSLQEQGFKLVFLFEMTFFVELTKNYNDKVLKFEEKLEDLITNTPEKLNNFLKYSLAKKKTMGDSTGWKVIHVATKDGFSSEEIVYLGKVDSSESRRLKEKTFMEAFETIVSNTKLVPDKSCILLYYHPHRVALSKMPTVPKKVTKLETLSKKKGQTNIPDFFKVTMKSKSVASPYKKPEKIPKYCVEKLVKKLRGDTVKILWIPTGYYNLDPSQYVTVFLRNEIALRVESKEDADLRSSVDEALSRLPNGMWMKAFEFMEEAIAYYLKDGNAAKDEAGPSGFEKKFDAAVAAFDQQAARHSSTGKENVANVEIKIEIEEEILG